MKRVASIALCLGLVACDGVEETGAPPPSDALYFPVGMAAHPDGRFLYIANGVFDRRYNAGTLVVYDTFRRRLLTDETVRIGLFAGELAVGRQACDGCEGEARGFLVTRDDNRLVSFGLQPDSQGLHLDCERDGAACGGGSFLDSFGVAKDFEEDPYGVALDGGGLFVTHVGRGVLSRWLTDAAGQPSFGCSLNLAGGATGVARHPVLGWAFVTDRYGHEITMVEARPLSSHAPVGTAAATRCELTVKGTILVDPLLDRGRTRGLAFSADGTLLYVASSPDGAMRIYDTSIDSRGKPRGRLVATLPVGIAADIVRVAGLRPGESRADTGMDLGSVGQVLDAKGEGLVYVSAFSDDRVVVIDPSAGLVRAHIEVGSGPHEIIFLPDVDGLLRGYVNNFNDHTISVIDLEPGSPTRFEVLSTVP